MNTSPNADRLNRFLHVLGLSPSLLGVLLHPVPQGSKRGARISVLNVVPGEGAHDVAGAFSLLSGQILEVAFEILVDPNGQLGHHLRRDCCLNLYITYYT